MIEHDHVITILSWCGKALPRQGLKLVNLTRLSSSFFYLPDLCLITLDDLRSDEECPEEKWENKTKKLKANKSPPHLGTAMMSCFLYFALYFDLHFQKLLGEKKEAQCWQVL